MASPSLSRCIASPTRTIQTIDGRLGHFLRGHFSGCRSEGSGTGTGLGSGSEIVSAGSAVCAFLPPELDSSSNE